jgi:biopolymer transport protein ExbD
MAMSSSGGDSDAAQPNINVTPLIDVLLVLLIIFMIIAPLKPSRFETKVPAEPKDEKNQAPPKPNPLTLVVSISSPDMKIQLNTESMGDISDTQAITAKLTQIFKDRESNGVYREGTNEIEKTVFVKGPKTIKYGEVVKLIDAIKTAGAQPVGLQVDNLPQ